jgi:hypothetical protein
MSRLILALLFVLLLSRPVFAGVPVEPQPPDPCADQSAAIIVPQPVHTLYLPRLGD